MMILVKKVLILSFYDAIFIPDGIVLSRLIYRWVCRKKKPEKGTHCEWKALWHPNRDHRYKATIKVAAGPPEMVRPQMLSRQSLIFYGCEKRMGGQLGIIAWCIRGDSVHLSLGQKWDWIWVTSAIKVAWTLQCFSFGNEQGFIFSCLAK